VVGDEDGGRESTRVELEAEKAAIRPGRLEFEQISFGTCAQSVYDSPRGFSRARNLGVTSACPTTPGVPGYMGGIMAVRRKKKKVVKRSSGDLIISKARTKAAVKKCNVGGEFYGALDKVVREMIKGAEARAIGNKRKTLKAVDI
jgi:histone H3/H4